MKWPLLLLLVLLAGCTLPGDEAEEPQLFGACPQWIAGQAIEEAGRANGSLEMNLSAPESHQNRSLDMFLLEVTTSAPMRVQAHLASGSRTAFHQVEDGRLLNPPTWEVDGAEEARVFLSPVAQGAQPAPGPIRLSFDGTGDIQVTATPHYRVCGVLLD